MSLTISDLQEAFLKEYEFEQGAFFSGHMQKDDCIFAWNDVIPDALWNHAAKLGSEGTDINHLVDEVIAFFKKKNRRPAVCITSFTRPANLADLLEQSGFKPEGTDAWMFYEKGVPSDSLPVGFSIKQVTSLEEMQVFVDLFDRAHTGAPDEPYGKLPPEYGESLLRFYQHSPTDGTVLHYLGCMNNEPVGYATLIYAGRFAGIYNVGTIPQYRRRGIASALTLRAVTDALIDGVQIVFLITEQGSYNERFYTKLGFTTKFVVRAYVLE